MNDLLHPRITDDVGMPETPFYPMYVSLRARICLVVGGGSVGERKVQGLLASGAAVRVVAERLSPWLSEQVENGLVDRVGRIYDVGQLMGVDLVFAATDDKGLNRQIAHDAESRRVWCNMATDPERGSFIVPSVVRRGPLTVAFSTGGLSPALAKRIREQFERQFDARWVLYLELMGRLRRAVKEKNLTTGENRRIFRDLAGLPVPEWLEANDHERILSAIHEICGSQLSLPELTHIWKELCSQCYSPLPPSAIAAARSGT